MEPFKNIFLDLGLNPNMRKMCISKFQINALMSKGDLREKVGSSLGFVTSKQLTVSQYLL